MVPKASKAQSSYETSRYLEPLFLGVSKDISISLARLHAEARLNPIILEQAAEACGTARDTTFVVMTSDTSSKSWVECRGRASESFSYVSISYLFWGAAFTISAHVGVIEEAAHKSYLRVKHMNWWQGLHVFG